MKKFLSLTILMFLCLFTYGQNGVFLFKNQSDTLCINTNEILSMSVDIDRATQIIDCVDTLFSIPVGNIDSISFVKPEDCVKFFDSETRNELYFGKDGAYLNVSYDEQDSPISLQMIVSDTAQNVIFIKTLFDNNQRPIHFSFNENAVDIFWHDDNHCDITYVFADSVAYKVDNVEYFPENEVKSLRKSPGFGQTWQKKLGGVLYLAGGAISIATGAVMIAGSGAAEIFTVGSSTPISVPAIALGGLAIKGGVDTFDKGFKTLFHPELVDHPKDAWKSTVSMKASTQMVKPVVNRLLPQSAFPYLADQIKYGNITKNSGWAGFFLKWYGDVFSAYGESYNWYDHYRYIMDDGDYKKVVTGLVKDIGPNCATIRGYVSPDILKSPFDGTRFNTEYGIIVRSINDRKDLHTYIVENGEGGNFECTFTDLKPDEEYSYVAFFNDKSNQIFRFGEFKTFRTKVAPEISISIPGFVVTKSQYKEGGFTNDGEKYDFRFDATVTVELYANDYSFVKKWGYVYEDPKGKKVEIPLSGTSATDSRYAYFRNSAHSTARLYGFAYIVGMEEPIYGEIHDFPLDHAMAVANTGDCVEVKTKCATVNCSFENVPQGAKCGVEYRYEENWLKHESNSSEGTQTITISGLQSGTKYYYRAYIDDNGQLYYGGEKEFTTEYEIPDITGTWSCNIYKDDGSILNSLNITLTDDGKATQQGSDRIPENTIGGWSVGIDGKVGVNFSWDGVRWTWFGEQFSGQVNSLTNPSQIEGTVWRGYATEMHEGGTTYRFVMTK